ncbi:MAG: hypothetical protein WB359_13140 [Bryobacteraceae bacterium]
MRSPDSEQRPLAFEEGNFLWNMQRVPETLPDGKTIHPGRSCAIFLVHGMGVQPWTETAAHLRAGFEDALERIAAWQKEHKQARHQEVALPPPFIYEGYWADYDNLEATFPEDWGRFNQREQSFFGNLWKHRVVSGARTVGWMLHQQLRLLGFKVLREVGPFVWILYWPFQIVSVVALVYAWFRYPEAISGYVNEVRLYLDPRGVAERAIVQRIDDRVGEAFLRMIGLDREFRPLPDAKWIWAGGQPIKFERVVWVAHSLGTVISYNVLSALFHRAGKLELTGDDEQKAGVERFRRTLSRFITMGSPLDKVAFLFRKKSLCPWTRAGRRALLSSGERLAGEEPGSDKTEWWINFYHVLDPVSGALQSPFICGNQPPSNIHIRFWLMPGLAHVGYWTDPTTLRFILGRTYGTAFLKDQEYRAWSPWVLSALAVIGYFVWAAILCGFGYAFFRWAPLILRWAGKVALKWITG